MAKSRSFWIGLSQEPQKNNVIAALSQQEQEKFHHSSGFHVLVIIPITFTSGVAGNTLDWHRPACCSLPYTSLSEEKCNDEKNDLDNRRSGPAGSRAGSLFGHPRTRGNAMLHCATLPGVSARAGVPILPGACR
jgi:hypothetical protein